MSAAQEIVTHDGLSAPVASANVIQHADGLLSVIERAARDPSVDLDKFERLMAMQERIQHAEAERQFNAALAAAKGEFPTIRKNRTVDFTSQKGRTNYRYEDLSEIARAIDPVLARHGLSYRFKTVQDSGKITVTCVLTHRAGHSEGTTLSAGEDHSGNKNSIQAIGSSVRYLQRYTLTSALGLSVSNEDEDDDGKAATDISAEDLIAEGEGRANAGTAALQDWWQRLPKDHRKMVGTAGLERLKSIAGEAR